jgi:hypothetical protein
MSLPTDEIYDYLIDFFETEFEYSLYAYSEKEYLVMGPSQEHLAESHVALVAHVDTVGDFYPRGSETYNSIYMDLNTNSKIRSCGDCFLDDRLGVIAIVKAVAAGYKPIIIFTKDEECGCLGACALVTDYPSFDTIFNKQDNVQCLIEIDRRGVDEVVFYDLDYPEFETLFYPYYQKQTKFAFTDICVLGPGWGIAAANVSAGYNKEHSDSENTSLEAMALASQRLLKTIPRFYSSQREDRFEYKGKESLFSSLMLGASYQWTEGDNSWLLTNDLSYQQFHLY